ncbi:hypothetical protein SHI21_20145 [Bacteriovorax sp. PP10]|uniref:Fibronectin type-III domain-containing protein n=1 Tax=Bacteriovorax antarcticus TaxID=3088717 RepID=A0ABU5W204_9BACT|nr:hypothetical protein [Bacteriovorax sp. PP10]MEA9358559.1 hypothetical protein [Bacteriovorax sp. PP10]
MKSFIFVLTILFLTISCKQESKNALPFTYNKPGNSPIVPTIATSMTLVSPASTPGFDATPVFSLSGVVSGETIKIFTNSACTNLAGSAVASASSVTITSQTLSVGTFNFYSNTTNAYTTSACSGLLTSYQYLGIAPTTATSMTLISPASSPGTVATPAVRLFGMVSGETGNLYVDSNCSQSYGSALVSGTTATIISSQLAPGVNQFYTNSTNTAGTGTCSAALLSYNYLGVLPTSATALTLSTPSTSPNYVSTPTFMASGVSNGDTVNLYTDASCLSLVGIATSTGGSVYVTSSALSVGTHSFYTNSSNLVGSSACSSALSAYNYLGPAPSVQISWNANREKAVNKTGGGYRIYYSRTSGIDPASASYYDVPYVAGPTAPVTKTLSNLLIGTTYFKVSAYSNLNAPGSTSGTMSDTSTEFSITLP